MPPWPNWPVAHCPQENISRCWLYLISENGIRMTVFGLASLLHSCSQVADAFQQLSRRIQKTLDCSLNVRLKCDVSVHCCWQPITWPQEIELFLTRSLVWCKYWSRGLFLKWCTILDNTFKWQKSLEISNFSKIKSWNYLISICLYLFDGILRFFVTQPATKNNKIWTLSHSPLTFTMSNQLSNIFNDFVIIISRYQLINCGIRYHHRWIKLHFFHTLWCTDLKVQKLFKTLEEHPASSLITNTCSQHQFPIGKR